MTSAIFPARADIGYWTGPDGQQYGVKMTPEFERCLGALANQTGGTTGFSSQDLSVLEAMGVDIPATSVPNAVTPGNVDDLGALVAVLQDKIAQLEAKFDAVDSARAAEVGKYAESLEIMYAFNVGAAASGAVVWERPGKIGSATPNTGAFTTLSVTGIFTSTLATGTAPFTIASTTKVANLNADFLDGNDWTAPGAIGGTTPAAATFTTCTANGGLRTGLNSALVTSTVAMNNGAAAAAGTLANAPVAGNPTKWVPINDNGTTRYVPAW